MIRVDVLMATYNGAPYLREQIDSVFAQEGVDVRLLVRDDGSTDGTLALLQEYMQRFPGRFLVVDDGLGRQGASGNFFRLLCLPSDAEFFAFCDQDDVWNQDKLKVAAAALSDAVVRPALYCSAVDYVDSNLVFIASSSRPTTPGFSNALAENIAQGCTMVMNAALRRFIVERVPLHATIHDWWTYLVAAAFGVVIYDEKPRMLYRQHGGNVVGGNFSFREKWKKRYRRFVHGNTWKMAAQAEELVSLYRDDLSEEKKALVRHFVAGRYSVQARFVFLFSSRIRRQSVLETLVIKFLVLINKY